MATLNLSRLESEFRNRWVVLNRELKVLDSSEEFAVLRARWPHERPFTYYFVSS